MSQVNLETYLNDGVLMMFSPPVDQTFKQDALDSSLYSQLAASKQFNKFTDYQQWRATLIKALTTFGWLRMDLTDNQVSGSETFAVADVVRKLLPRTLVAQLGNRLDRILTWLFTAEASKVMNAMVERRPCDSTEPRVAGKPEFMTSVVFQVAFVLPSREKVLLCIAFETHQLIDTSVLAQRLLTRQLVGGIKSFVLVGELDDLRYSLHRERVATALADKRAACSHRIEGLSS